MNKSYLLLTILLGYALSIVAQEDSTPLYKLRLNLQSGERVVYLCDELDSLTFEEVQPMQGSVIAKRVDTRSILFAVSVPSTCSKWYMKVSDEPLGSSTAEIRKAILNNYDKEYQESIEIDVQALTPDTDYYFYALLFDEEGLPTTILETQVRTLVSTSTEEFVISISDVTPTDAHFTFTPESSAMRYYYFLVPESSYDIMVNNFGGIQAADLAFFTDMSEQTGYSLSDYISAVTFMGPQEVTAQEILSSPLIPNSKYYVYCYGIEPNGTFTTDVYLQSFTTPQNESSQNKIDVVVTKTYSNGCDVRVTTTNDDPYFMNVQSKEVWERKLSGFGGDARATAEDIIQTISFYGGGIDHALYSGNQETARLSYGTPDTDCVVIYCGYKDGITTEVKTVEFRTVDQ